MPGNIGIADGGFNIQDSIGIVCAKVKVVILVEKNNCGKQTSFVKHFFSQLYRKTIFSHFDLAIVANLPYNSASSFSLGGELGTRGTCMTVLSCHLFYVISIPLLTDSMALLMEHVYCIKIHVHMYVVVITYHVPLYVHEHKEFIYL